jgi:hypothetical protein
MQVQTFVWKRNPGPASCGGSWGEGNGRPGQLATQKAETYQDWRKGAARAAPFPIVTLALRQLTANRFCLGEQVEVVGAAGL